MIPSEIPLDSLQAWVGVWIRDRSGPTRLGRPTTIRVGRWHRIAVAGSRITPACGGGPRNGLMWPSGGARLEVARPFAGGELPGEVCMGCLAPQVTVELEEPGDEYLDEIADRVVAKLDAIRKTAEREAGK